MCTVFERVGQTTIAGSQLSVWLNLAANMTQLIGRHYFINLRPVFSKTEGRSQNPCFVPMCHTPTSRVASLRSSRMHARQNPLGKISLVNAT